MALLDHVVPNFFYFSLILYGLSALVAVILYSKPRLNIKVSYCLSALASALAFVFSIYALVNEKYPITLSGLHIEGFENYFGDSGFFSLYLDPLALFIIAVISFVAFYTSIFSIGYSEMYIGEYSISYLNFFYSTFVLSMILVVAANDVLAFYLSWELMTVTSYMLVGYEHLKEENRNAAKVYFIMAHIGGACILISFALLSFSVGSFSFDVFRMHPLGSSIGISTVIFALSLVGFGSKAGIVPLHAWLPLAHPAAPSNASALLSGVMLKVAIYGLIRVIFDFLGSSGIVGMIWGCVALFVAAISTIIGVQFAVVQHDLKKLLAYHSIENVGIILLGVGASIILFSMGFSAVASLALVAGLYHLMNHAVFKSLLFLGSGSILRSCKTRNFEQLGGLSGYLPWTSFTFLIAAMAISGLPPFNGFASEWLIYQSLLASTSLGLGTVPWISCLAMFSIFMLGLAGALAVMCFTKVYGVTFLGPPGQIKPSKGETISMKVGLVIPALACILLGILMPYVTLFISIVSYDVVGTFAPVDTGNIAFLGIYLSSIKSELSLAFMALVLVLMTGLIGTLLATRRIRIIRTEPWVSGVKYQSQIMRPTATAYAYPIRSLFAGLYGVNIKETKRYSVPPIYANEISYEIELRPKIEAYTRIGIMGPPYSATGRLPRLSRALENLLYKPFARPIFGLLEIRPEYEERIVYSPIARLFMKISNVVKKIQAGYLYLYMLYIVITVVLLLILAVMVP